MAFTRPLPTAQPRIVVLPFLLALTTTFAGAWFTIVSANEVLMLVPDDIQAGGRSSVTLTTVSAAGGEPVDLAISLVLLREATRTPLATARSGEDGHVTVEFDVPALDPGVYHIEAAIEGIAAPLDAQVTVSRTPAILIETDKPIYKPGQTIHGRVLLLDNVLRPREGDVEISIHDAKGIRVHRVELAAHEFGIAPFDLTLAHEVNFGVWKIKATSEGVQSSRDVRVEHYVLPRYELGANFDRSWVLLDDAIGGRVEARYFFGKPVAGTVDIVASRYVGTWEVFARTGGQLSDGAFDFELPPVGFVAGTPGNNGLGTVTLEITATDSTGHTQSTTEVLTVSETPVVLALVSKSDSLKPGIVTEVVVTAEEPDGTPVDIAVTIARVFRNSGERIITTRTLEIDTVSGVANFSLTPPAQTARATITATAATGGRTASATLDLASAWSPSSSFLAVTRTGSQQPAEVGEAVTFRATSTRPGTVFYDVYAGGRTVFSGTSKDHEIRFFAIPEMAPKAKLVAYIINPDSEISADTVPLDVVLPTTIAVTSTIDREGPKPGDEITLTIDTGVRAMVGLAIVDRSVLALGKSRLHLGEVFAELERRFMEPKGETHGGHGDVIEPGFGWRKRGAIDVLADVGLTLVTTAGIQAPGGQNFWRWAEEVDFLAEGPPVPVLVAEGGGSEPPGDPVRVRQFFPETWVWNPMLLTDENGVATLSLTVPDSITSWSVSTVASGIDGLGFGQSEVTVFQDFFVEPDIPVAVTRGEEFPVRVQIYNYLEEPQTVTLEFGDGEWFNLLGSGDLTVDVPAGAAIAADFPIVPTAIGEHEVRVLARGTTLSDAVIRTIRVEPEGEPVARVFNSVIESGSTVTLDTSLPDHSVPGSARAFLHITPSPIAQTLAGISDLLSMPYGCGEQNMIFLAPDIEILRYLQASGEVMPEIQAEAEYFINVGYQRELTFQTDDGGFAAFGGAEGSLWLTDFVLSTLSIARDVRDIDESVLAHAAAMVMGRQNPDGSFRTDDFLIHKEMDGGLENLYAMTAYTANALVDYGAPAVLSVLGKAADYLQDERSMVNDDAYSLSIAAVVLSKIGGAMESTASAVVDRLLELAIHDGIGMHWEPYPIETTGYVTLALMAQNRPEVAEAIDWLSTQRNSLGGYGQSTQDTVVAIRALTEAALVVRQDLDATLTVTNGGTTLAAITVNETNYDVLQSVELPVDLGDGLALESAGSGNVGFQVAVKFHVPAEHLPPPKDMEIEVTYDADGVEVDDIVDVRVRVQYTGFKEETGMTLVDIAVPTGFRVIGSTLEGLVEQEVASRVDVAGRKVIIYIDALTRNIPLEFAFQVRALYPVRAEAPISKVYEYYDLDVQATTRGDPIVIGPTGSRDIFVRGDANGDGLIDISDAVRILGYLFLGASTIDCEDRADVDDDGQVSISDAISLLSYLFRNGPAPEEPFPEAGTDATDDSLHCPADLTD